MSESTGALLSVVVLSCGSLGVEVAERLLGVPGVGCVTLVTAPYRQPSRSIAGKIRQVHRMQGWRGLAAVAARRLVAPLREREAEPSLAAAAGGPSSAIPHLHFPDFHDPA